MDRINKSGLDNHKKQIGEAERELKNIQRVFGEKIDTAEDIAKGARKDCHGNIDNALKKFQLGLDAKFSEVETKIKTSALAASNNAGGGNAPGGGRAGRNQ